VYMIAEVVANTWSCLPLQNTCLYIYRFIYTYIHIYLDSVGEFELHFGGCIAQGVQHDGRPAHVRRTLESNRLENNTQIRISQKIQGISKS